MMGPRELIEISVTVSGALWAGGNPKPEPGIHRSGNADTENKQ